VCVCMFKYVCACVFVCVCVPVCESVCVTLMSEVPVNINSCGNTLENLPNQTYSSILESNSIQFYSIFFPERSKLSG